MRFGHQNILFTFLVCLFSGYYLKADSTVDSNLVNNDRGGQTVAEEKAIPEGHLKPFGSHRPKEGDIETVDELIDPREFYKKYVQFGTSRPVVFRNAAKHIPAYKLWTDEYLAEKFGNVMIDAEIGKKEDRSGNGKHITMKHFLKTYKTDDIYMVNSANEDMYKDLSVPKPVHCGGYVESLSTVITWFSSGGTKSVLHNDDLDNINCLMDGHKELYMVDPKYDDLITKMDFNFSRGYSMMDVEKVDLVKYPHLTAVPWWYARMEKGDCLFIPWRWYHTVTSSESRNLAVNLWFSHIPHFNQSDCDRHEEIPDYTSLYVAVKNVGRTKKSGEKRGHLLKMLLDFEGQETVNITDFYYSWAAAFGLTKTETVQLYKAIDANSDRLLDWNELMAVDMEGLAALSPDIDKKLNFRYEGESDEYGDEEGNESDEESSDKQDSEDSSDKHDNEKSSNKQEDSSSTKADESNSETEKGSAEKQEL